MPDSTPPAPPALPDGVITIDDFKRVDLRTAKVIEVLDHPNADKLYLLKVQIGDVVKQIVAGIKAFVKPEDLLGKTVIVVHNLQPAVLRGQTSQGMLLAARLPEGGLTLATVFSPDAPSGLRLS